MSDLEQKNKINFISMPESPRLQPGDERLSGSEYRPLKERRSSPEALRPSGSGSATGFQEVSTNKEKNNRGEQLNLQAVLQKKDINFGINNNQPEILTRGKSLNPGRKNNYFLITLSFILVPSLVFILGVLYSKSVIPRNRQQILVPKFILDSNQQTIINKHYELYSGQAQPLPSLVGTEGFINAEALPEELKFVLIEPQSLTIEKVGFPEKNTGYEINYISNKNLADFFVDLKIVRTEWKLNFGSMNVRDNFGIARFSSKKYEVELTVIRNELLHSQVKIQILNK